MWPLAHAAGVGDVIARGCQRRLESAHRCLASGPRPLPGVGVLLELYDLAVSEVPMVGYLHIEVLARCLDDAFVAALHHYG